MSLAGAINVGKYNNKGELEYDHDVQEFENLPFKIKVETLKNEDNATRLFFFDYDPEKKIEVPEGIIVKDVTFARKIIKDPLPDTNYFLITHPMKYVVYYDPVKKRKTTKRTKIYSINSQKKYSIHNFRKTNEILEKECEKREKRENKRLDNAINSITAQLLAKINELIKMFEEQKNEMKKNHANEISLFREIITAKDKEITNLISTKTTEITNLMSIIDNHSKEIERIYEMRKKHEYEYNERLKEKDKIHKREKEERERTYKRETDLLQQTIDRLEQTIRSLQTQISENISPNEY
ncbi:5844_t:CDS:2, partial [Racocetra fulgida]